MKQPKLIMFDIDGTLTESKSPVSPHMAAIFSQLVSVKKAAIISGGKFEQFEKQFLAYLTCAPSDLKNLFVLPASGTQLWTYDTETNSWKEQYENDFSAEEKEKIMMILEKVVHEHVSTPAHIYGDQIEDRGSEITFSALGQRAPVEEKLMWDPDKSQRISLQAILQSLLPEFEVRVGGITSIDITKKGYDKAYGVQKLSEYVNLPISSMLYVGDELSAGGNDEVVKRTGVETYAVATPNETAELIGGLL